MVLFVCLSIFFRYTNRTLAANYSLVLAIVGSLAIRYNLSVSLLPKDHLSANNTKDIISFEGIIYDCFIREDGRNRYLLNIESIVTLQETIPVTGKVLVYTKKISTLFTYGDRIRFFGTLNVPDKKRFPGQFDYRTYLAAEDIYYIFTLSPSDTFTIVQQRDGQLFLQNIVMPLRAYFRNTFDMYLADQTRDLLKALILGEKQDLDNDMIARFQQVGVVHVLAISGLHVGFIIAFVFGFASLLRFERGKKLALLIFILTIYIVLVRFKTPVIRASSMAILFLIAKNIERQVSVYNIIFASMFFILMIDPRELFKPGFQFSFLAVLSIIYGYEKLNDLMPLKTTLNSLQPKWLYLLFIKAVWIPLLVSLSAVLGTLPLTLYYYGTIPLYAIFANLIVIPLTGLIVFLSLFLLLLASFSMYISTGIGMMITFIDKILQHITELFSSLPYASIITIKPTLYQIILLYIGIYLIITIKTNGWRRTLVSLSLPLILLVLSFELGAEEDLRVTFLDIGQGDAVFVEFPNGKNMLIDAGNASRHWDHGEKTVLPFLQFSGIRKINYLVGSHAHNDHIGGFPYLMETISIDTLVLSAYQYRSNLFKEIESKRATHHIHLRTVYKGDQLFPDPTCRVYILHPDSGFSLARNYSGMECNNSSIVMKIQYGDNGILLTGDLERGGEIPVLIYNSFLESEIIKVGHHGSITSTSMTFLENVAPIAAVVSVAKKNKFNHPSPHTIERLKNWGVKTFLTSHEGTVQYVIKPDMITRIGWR